MNLIKTALFGALGCLAWRAWQRQKAAANALPDALADALPGSSQPRHGTIRLEPAVEPAHSSALAGAQSSPRFGADTRDTR